MKTECDIILLSYESPHLLKACVRSVLEYTRVPSRLIIVDNASKNPEVKYYLREVHGNDNVTVEKIFNKKNEGFAAGMNRGMRLSKAPFLCLLNNDCVVTDGWLEEMIDIACRRDDIGLVNPQSNTFGSRPGKGVSVEEHAALLAHKKGNFVELGQAIGFACLIKREVIESIGHLDEVYEGVCYEDTDFSARAQKHGYIAVMAEGAYVFHAEQASRRNLKGKERTYRRNRKIFEDRWGRLLRIFVLDRPAGGNDRNMSEYYEILRGIARERVIIEMWVRRESPSDRVPPGPDSSNKEMIRHADIGIHTFSQGLIWPAVMWRVLTKKKRYDAAVIRDEFILRGLRFLRPFHRAEVFSLEEGMRVRTESGREIDLRKPAHFAGYLRGKE